MYNGLITYTNLEFHYKCEAMTLHVELPESLASRIEEVYDKEGYATKSDLVRDATRRRLEELRE